MKITSNFYQDKNLNWDIKWNLDSQIDNINWKFIIHKDKYNEIISKIIHNNTNKDVEYINNNLNFNSSSWLIEEKNNKDRIMSVHDEFIRRHKDSNDKNFYHISKVLQNYNDWLSKYNVEESNDFFEFLKSKLFFKENTLLEKLQNFWVIDEITKKEINEYVNKTTLFHQHSKNLNL